MNYKMSEGPNENCQFYKNYENCEITKLRELRKFARVSNENYENYENCENSHKGTKNGFEDVSGAQRELRILQEKPQGH